MPVPEEATLPQQQSPDAGAGRYNSIPENLQPIPHRLGQPGSKDVFAMYPVRFDHFPRFDFQGSANSVLNLPTVILDGVINRSESIFLHSMLVTTLGAPTTAIIELLFSNTRIWPITPNEDQTRANNGLTGMPYLGFTGQSARLIALNKLFDGSKQGSLQVIVTANVAAAFYASISYSLFTGV